VRETTEGTAATGVATPTPAASLPTTDSDLAIHQASRTDDPFLTSQKNGVSAHGLRRV
jgi:hypothetical protein